MSELISGKEALIALANGEEVEYRSVNSKIWQPLIELSINDALNGRFMGSYSGNHDLVFRLKPRTITINGREVNNMFDAFLTISNAYNLSPEKWCEIRKILNP